jgi:predicted RNA-binding Zn-ribbon protein involved in translation (DUF1610 family)
MSYMVEIVCECGEWLCGDIEPGETFTAPECPHCGEKFQWPDKATLLAVYGAPYNWPVAA